MKKLKYFVIGATSIIIILPTLERLLELIELWIDVLKTKPEEKLLNNKINMQTKKEFLKPTPPVYDDYDDDYEDFDEEE